MFKHVLAATAHLFKPVHRQHGLDTGVGLHERTPQLAKVARRLRDLQQRRDDTRRQTHGRQCNSREAIAALPAEIDVVWQHWKAGVAGPGVCQYS